MNVLKHPGQLLCHPVSDEDLALINELTHAQLTASQVYTFAIRLCDNEIDRDFERFDHQALVTLQSLFIGKSGIFDHNWSAANQTARIYKTEVCPTGTVTQAGDDGFFLKGYAYMLANEKNQALIDDIEGGIKKEVSIGCAVAHAVCSICGKEHCGHIPGKSYDGTLCYRILSHPTDAYEWSFVAVPAQRDAGVIKGFCREATLRSAVSHSPLLTAQLDALEADAALGRSYLKELQEEVRRLLGASDAFADLAVFSGMTERLTAAELKELRRVYQLRLDRQFSPTPQLPTPSAPSSPVCPPGDSEFLI